jgi:protocatechuate 3,4-dioxygenase beta subunit
MKKAVLFSVLAFSLLFSNCGQTQSAKQPGDKTVGGACDRCDIMYEGMPPLEKISAVTYLAKPGEPGERMDISGTVFMKDGRTPAKNIVLYLYHTDAKGLYTPSGSQTAGRANGHLRGWVKTGDDGKFTIHSIRPSPYPGGNIPAHIHILVKEPGKTRYYIDEVWFDDDAFVTPSLKAAAEKRGGDMIIHLTKANGGSLMGNMSIILGLNIPGY